MLVNPPSIFQSQSMEKWKKKLGKHPKIEEYVAPLISTELSLTEKYWVEKTIPFKKKKTIQWLERQLDGVAPFEIVQMIRYDLYLKKYFNNSSQQWCHDRAVAEIKCSFIVQKEIHVRQKVQALRKAIGLSSSEERHTMETQLEGAEDKLQSLNDQYWLRYRNIGRLDGNIPRGPMERGFTALRKNPDWYLSDWFREDCAKKGGCCARDCGCCEKPRDTHRELNRGHCTAACGCCIRTRSMTDPNRLKDLKDFPFDLVNRDTPYSRRFYRAFIWGVEFINEFD